MEWHNQGYSFVSFFLLIGLSKKLCLRKFIYFIDFICDKFVFIKSLVNVFVSLIKSYFSILLPVVLHLYLSACEH